MNPALTKSAITSAVIALIDDVQALAPYSLCRGDINAAVKAARDNDQVGAAVALDPACQRDAHSDGIAVRALYILVENTPPAVVQYLLWEN